MEEGIRKHHESRFIYEQVMQLNCTYVALAC